MEKVNCDLCRSDKAHLLFRAKDIGQGLPGSFNLLRCSHCGLVYLNPRPSREEMMLYYPRQYYGFETGDTAACFRRKKTGESIQKFIKKGRLLDLGSGKGLFLSVMKELGFESYGVELSPQAADFARKTYRVDVFTGELKDAKFPGEYFDLVTIWHVLEHLPSPAESLQEIARIMKKNGMVIIAVPNFSSLQSRISRNKWYPLEIPRHLYQFEPGTLKRLLSGTGFQVIKITHFNHFINFVSCKKSILNLLSKGAGPERDNLVTQMINTPKGNFTRQALKILLDGGSFFFSELENLLGCGGTITAYARKK